MRADVMRFKLNLSILEAQKELEYRGKSFRVTLRLFT